jgi:hypothetical protein
MRSASANTQGGTPERHGGETMLRPGRNGEVLAISPDRKERFRLAKTLSGL